MHKPFSDYRQIVVNYLVVGVLFGLLFPLVAVSLVIWANQLVFAWSSIVLAHQQNFLLYIIDSAPLFLGLFAAAAGVNQANAQKNNDLLERQALTDELTKSNNRQFGQLALKKMLPLARKQKQRIALLFIDIDRFKILNDTMGHRFGDLVLTAFAQRLKEVAQAGELFARVGGDEFLVISKSLQTADDIDTLARRYAKVANESLFIDGRRLPLSVSMGIAMFPDHGDSMEALFQHASVALYENRKHKRAPYELFNENLQRAINEEYRLEKALERAIERQELILVYQPIVDCQTGKIEGAEALLRWNSPEFGQVPPDRFIPLAEKSGLITEIGAWVLREATKEAVCWTELTTSPVFVSVNVSAEQLVFPIFVRQVKEILADTGLSPDALKLEITETVSMENLAEVLQIFRELRHENIRLSIDDFGTGYSSLSKLKLLAVDDLKIDKSFISDIKVGASEGELAIVEGIIAMAGKLGMHVVAEGVETRDQLAKLQAFGCDYIQGYYFSKPVNSEIFRNLLSTGGRFSA